MMKVLLFDDARLWQQLLPLTYTRPTGDLRVGILTVSEKWAAWLKAETGFHTREYLRSRFARVKAALWINGAVCPDTDLVKSITSLKEGQSLIAGELLIAAYSPGEGWTPESADNHTEKITYNGNPVVIDRPWKIFQLNASELKKDFELITKGRESARLTDPHTVIYGRENVFAEEGVSVRAAIIDAEKGPVYLGKNSSILEGAIVKGSFSLGENSIVNIGAKLRGDTSIGPNCKVGGEVSNTVMHSFSNKSHDGFLGNAVIGQWCNMGADTNSSNMKNNYTEVKVYDHFSNSFIETGSIFCGLIMGDHSKCGINTMFNTGTVVGVSANIFGAGFPRQYIPSFAWGGSAGFATFELSKAVETADAMMSRREISLTSEEREILEKIYELTTSLRVWEKEEA